MSFSFGGGAAGSSGFSFGGPAQPAKTTAPTATPAPGGFSFGAAPGQPAPTSSGFSFGAPATAAAPAFGAPATAAAPAFGAPATAAAPAFGAPATAAAPAFGAPATAAAPAFGAPAAVAAPSSGVSFGNPMAPASASIAPLLATPAASAPSFGFGGSLPTVGVAPLGGAAPMGGATSFSFGGAPAATVPPVPATTALAAPAAKPLSFGAPAPSAAPSLSLGLGSITTTTASAGFGFGAPAATATAPAPTAPTGGFSFGLNPSATTTSAPAIGGFSLPATSTVAALGTAPTASLNLGTSAITAAPNIAAAQPAATIVSTSAAPPSLNIGVPAASVAPSITSTPAISSTPVALSTVTTTTSSSAAASAASMNYRQLEEGINKWTLELEEQEKVFLNQATQVNAWDRLLMENGEKIVKLHESVEKVKHDQQRLEHELDFVKSQQSELEEILRPLEASLLDAPPPDAERERIYSLAENMDAQLQRMGDDLREIIEHLNSANRSTNESDPIVQISRVLNAHMDALQWVDQTSGLVQKKLEEVTKLQGIRRKESERIGIL